MDSQDNQNQAQAPAPEITSEENLGQVGLDPKKLASDFKKWLAFAGVFVLIGGLGIGAWIMNKEDKSLDSASDDSPVTLITSFDECVSAGYPVMESFPEKCSVPGGETFVREVSDVVGYDDPEECYVGYRGFYDASFGAQFCYPDEWGTTTIVDAKVGPGDTGHREMIRFSDNQNFAVGGTSEDWSTTVGRGVGCLEPNNSVPDISSYNIEWNNFEGEGADVMYAQRSLESSAGGYDITETVSNILENGVCVQSHKLIDGSRYRVFFMAYSKDFEGGVLTPSEHIDAPNVLFTEAERTQFDFVMATVQSY